MEENLSHKEKTMKESDNKRNLTRQRNLVRIKKLREALNRKRSQRSDLLEASAENAVAKYIKSCQRRGEVPFEEYDFDLKTFKHYLDDSEFVEYFDDTLDEMDIDWDDSDVEEIDLYEEWEGYLYKLVEKELGK